MGSSSDESKKAQPGDADLAAWSRAEAGEAGEFSNPDTEDWIIFRPRAGDLDEESVFDASGFVDAPSGKHGFLRATEEGRFVFEDGTAARFIGGQANVFPEKDFAEWHPRWLRRYGMNLVRGHGFGLPDEEKWDRLDYFISHCKRNGIYLILTPIYWTEFEVEDPSGEKVTVNSHVTIFFNRRLEEAARELWRTFYRHENPYTGLRYCDDPTICAFELKNEDSAFWAVQSVRRSRPHYWREILEQYGAFLGEKYGSTEALRAAWTDRAGGQSALGEDESLEEGNVEILRMGGWHQQEPPLRRKSDQTEFLHKKQREFYGRSYRFLREIGCKQAICGSNWRGHGYTMRHVLECDSHMDYADQHDYWDHPQGGWRTEVAVFHNKSMLQSPHGGLVGNLAPRRIVGLPYVLSEWNIGAWNQHVQEASFAMVSCGCLQGWDGLLQFVFVPRNSFRGISRLEHQFFNVAENPSVVLQYPTLSRIWHRGDIREAEPVFIRRVCAANLHRPGPIPAAYPAEAIMADAPQREPEEDEFDYLLPAVGKVGVEFVEEQAEHLSRDELIREHLSEPIRSVTGELQWDRAAGLCLIDTPMTQGLCGYVSEKPVETRDAVFEVNNSYCTILVTSLDDEAPLAESGNILVTALGRSRNTGTLYGRREEEEAELAPHAHQVKLPPEHRVAVLELGDEPVRSEPVRGTLRLAVARPEEAQVHTLDHVGRRSGTVETSLADGELLLPLPGDRGVYFYQIVL